MSKAAELAALIGSQTALTNRNLIINGAMQVAQRGTSGTIAANDGAAYKSIDRWQLSNALDVTATIAQSSTAPAGFTNSLKITVGGADDLSGSYDAFQVQQHIEAQNLQHLKYGTSSALSLTLSFWVRSSVTGTYVTHLYQSDGNDLISGSYTIDSADTWEYKTITYAGNTAAAPANDNGQGLRVTFMLGAATEYTSGTLPTAWEAYTDADSAAGQTANVASSASGEWYLTGVQLEVGEQATPFEHRSMGDELARCQRYFFNPMAGGNGQSSQISFHSMLNMGGSVSTGNNGHIAFHVPFPVSMRAAPSLTHDIDNDKIVTSAPSGTEVAFYIQNQGYRPKAGNGNLNTLSRATGTSAGCLVGTYYISPDNLKGDQINIGASNQFHFSAEL